MDSGDIYQSKRYDRDEPSDSQACLDECEAKVASLETWVSFDQCVDILILKSKLSNLAKVYARDQGPKFGTLVCARLPREVRDITCIYLWNDDARHLSGVDESFAVNLYNQPNKSVTCFLDKQCVVDPPADEAAQWYYKRIQDRRVLHRYIKQFLEQNLINRSSFRLTDLIRKLTIQLTSLWILKSSDM